MKFISLILFALLLLVPSLFNGFAFLYSDTGAYIQAAFNLYSLAGRPIGYGFFIRLTSLDTNLWGVIIIQSMLAAYLIYKSLESYFGNLFVWQYKITIACLLAFFSTLSWYVCFINPDCFTGLLILLLYIVFQNQSLSKVESFFLFFLIFLFDWFHYSNVILHFAMLIAIPIFSYFFEKKSIEQKQFFRRILSINYSCLIAAILLNCSLNYNQDGRFRLSRGSNTFLTARFSESGLLKKYLEGHCDQENQISHLCERKNDLPKSAVGFIWGGNSPLKQNKISIAKANEIYAPIIKEIFTSPKYLGFFIYTSIRDSIRQLFHVRAVFGKMNQQALFLKSLKRFYPNHFQKLNNAKQFGSDIININILLKWISFLSVVFSLIVILFYLFSKKNHSLLLSKFLFFLLSGYIFNAIITASLANVHHRLQSRVSWLLVLAMGLIICHFWQKARVKNAK